jgi:hypothetical protein
LRQRDGKNKGVKDVDVKSVGGRERTGKGRVELLEQSRAG